MIWLRDGPRYVLQAHGTSLENLKACLETRRGFWWGRLAYYLPWVAIEAATYRRACAVIAVSEQVGLALRRLPYRGAWQGTPLRVIANGVEVGQFLRGRDARDAGRRRFGLRGSDKVAITVSRLTWQKGVDRCIAALPLTSPSVKLIVVGDGPEQAALTSRAEELGVRDRVVFAGGLAHSEVPQALAAADVFVFPVRGFRCEGLSIAVLEALASGLRVIVPIGSTWPRDLISELDFVSVDDAEALAKALEPPVNASEVRARRLPLTYDVTAVAKRYRDVLLGGA
jgi:glycosyltransferase involved in cell wall biosynthesis